MSRFVSRGPSKSSPAATADDDMPSTSTTSSRAVLSALRALQDKIKRLETERSVAFEETETLRQQLRGLETEQDQLRARDDAMAQRNIMEARNQYDRLLAEKTDLEARVSRAEERKRDMQRAHEDLKDEIRALLDEKQLSLSKIKDFESQISSLESQLGTLQRKESELGQTLGWEVKRHDDEMEALNKRLEELQKDLLQTVKEKSALDTKMAELDHLVGQLLAINESLVTKLTGADEKKVKKKSVKSVPASPSKSITNAVSEAKTQSESIKAAAAKLKVLNVRNSEMKVKKPSSPSYADQLSSRNKVGGRATERVARDVRSMKGVNSMYHDLLRELVTDKDRSSETPSLAQRSNCLISASAAASEAVRAASTAAAGKARNAEATRLLERELEGFDYGPDGALYEGKEDEDADEDGSEDEKDSKDAEEEVEEEKDEEEKTGFPSPMTFDVQSRSPAALKSYSFGALVGELDVKKGLSLNERRDDAASDSSADYHTKLAGLELEFVELDQQYHHILKGVDGSGSATDTADAAEQLVEVIRKLHEKGRDLRELRASPSKSL